MISTDGWTLGTKTRSGKGETEVPIESGAVARTHAGRTITLGGRARDSQSRPLSGVVPEA